MREEMGGMKEKIKNLKDQIEDMDNQIKEAEKIGIKNDEEILLLEIKNAELNKNAESKRREMLRAKETTENEFLRITRIINIRSGLEFIREQVTFFIFVYGQFCNKFFHILLT